MRTSQEVRLVKHFVKTVFDQKSVCRDKGYGIRDTEFWGKKTRNPFIWKKLKFGLETILVQSDYTGLCVTVQLYRQVPAC